MRYILRRFVRSGKIVTFSGILKREDTEVQVTYTYTWPQRSHQVVTGLGKYQQTFLKQNFVSKRTGKFQLKSFGGGTGQC